jgi:hypothetical protein
MDAWVWLVIAAVVIVIVAVVAAMIGRRRVRTDHLRERFGSEYERQVVADDRGARREAEAELERREQRREELDIRPLAPDRQERYLGAWQDIQLHFVDEPETSVADAEALLNQVMRERGYPIEREFEEQAALISVDHPELVDNYRRAHYVYEESRRQNADTEQLRSSLVYYRSLFDELLAA